MSNLRLVIRTADRAIFSDIAAGRKTIETRAASAKYQTVRPGDTLTFVCGHDSLMKSVVTVQHFRSITAMLDHLPLTDILPSAADRDEATAVLLSFPGNREKIAARGIMAFTLK